MSKTNNQLKDEVMQKIRLIKDLTLENGMTLNKGMTLTEGTWQSGTVGERRVDRIWHHPFGHLDFHQTMLDLRKQEIQREEKLFEWIEKEELPTFLVKWANSSHSEIMIEENVHAREAAEAIDNVQWLYPNAVILAVVIEKDLEAYRKEVAHV